MVLAGSALMAMAIVALASALARLSRDLSNLSMRKPIWLVETDERGVRKISILESRVAEIEAGTQQAARRDHRITTPYPYPDPYTDQVPSMDAPDEPVIVGTRG